jgi:hypothetical protein
MKENVKEKRKNVGKKGEKEKTKRNMKSKASETTRWKQNETKVIICSAGSHKNVRTYQDKEMRDHMVKRVNIRRMNAVKLPSIACE